MKIKTFRLDDETLDKLKRASKKTHINESNLIRIAVIEKLRRMGMR